MASQNHRVEKVEDALFGKLTPAGWVCEVLKAAAAGNMDLSYRIAKRCPRKAYLAADEAYVRRMDDAELACKIAVANFDRYAFACRQIEGLKRFLTQLTQLRQFQEYFSGRTPSGARARGGAGAESASTAV